jgi:hypothetical protein
LNLLKRVRAIHSERKNVMKIRIAFLAACFFGAVWAIQAQDPPAPSEKQDASAQEEKADPHRVLAEELLVAMDIPGTLERSFEMIKKVIPMQVKKMHEAASGADADEADVAERAQKATDKAMDLLSQELSWDKVKDDYISLYAKAFTDEELKGAIAFYKSPVGQAFIKKQPELMQQSMQLSQQRVLKVIPKIQALCEESVKGGEAQQDAKPGVPELKVKKALPLKQVPAKEKETP